MQPAPDLQSSHPIRPETAAGIPLPKTSDHLALARERLTKLFEFLKAHTQLRHPPVRHIADQLGTIWLNQIPRHECIEVFRDLPPAEQEPDDDAIVLRICRPDTTPCPPPPALLEGWLHSGWQKHDGPDQAASTRSATGTEGQAIVEHFHADPRRAQALRHWQEQRAKWLAQEQAAQTAMDLFDKVFAWYGAQEREGERIEILVGDGLLSFADEKGGGLHPILLQRLELEFHPEKARPEFILRKSEQPPALYRELLQCLPGADTRQLSRCLEEQKHSEFSPLSDEDTNGFFRRLIQGLFPSRGQFFLGPEAGRIAEKLTAPGQAPILYRDPVVFRRERRHGPENIYDLVLEDIPGRTDFPPSLLHLLGLSGGTATADTPVIGTGISVGNEDEAILFSKSANREQLEIAKQLEKHDCVLVQGPPGTGKTHTIANLLGHFLAQGRRVLVTAQTPKALRVLRQKIVDPLQPLCISVLQNDRQSQEELQCAVQQIHARLGQDPGALERDARSLQAERLRILESLRSARKSLLVARQDEVFEITVGEKSLRPVDAARLIDAGKGLHDWIPSPVALGTGLPLSTAELSELYQTQARLSPEDERALSSQRPDPASLPTPAEYKNLLDELHSLAGQNLRLRDDLWDNTPQTCDLADFDRMIEEASRAIEFLRDCSPWQLIAIQAGRDGDASKREWQSLIKQIESSWLEIRACHELVMEQGPELDGEADPRNLLPLLEGIIAHREAGHTFGVLTKITHRAAHAFQRQARINNHPLDLNNLVQLRAVRALLRIRHLRSELVSRWGRQMACNGGMTPAALGDNPEEVCKQFTPQIQACLDWHTDTWMPLEQQFGRLGFLWSKFLNSTPPLAGENAQLRRIRKAILGELGVILQSRSRWLRKHQLNARIEQLLGQLKGGGRSEAPCTRLLREAIRTGSPGDYLRAYRELIRLKSLEPVHNRRADLLDRLTRNAAAWASAIENRVPVHAAPEPPGDPLPAWEWRQFHDELERRAGTSLDELQQRIERLTGQLRDVTAQLVEKRTWLKQIRHTCDAHKQALGAFSAMRGKLTKTGKGVRDAEFRTAARKEMALAREAVPVWIMPLVDVATTFDPRRNHFDIVIIDEASQCDPAALYALYLARQAVIVGDDEQVTPVNVGINAADTSRLIHACLDNIPRKELYDGETSVYELAQIAFGSVIRLTEHFRCVPDIIAFSNALSYRGEIKPLRETSRSTPAPHVIAHRVASARADSDNVNTAEAEEIAALICAAVEQPEYARNEAGETMTMGVISLVGEKQALKIDSLLRQRLDPGEYSRRKILCGDPAQFQGDERDIMFISLVDSPSTDAPLPLRQEGPKKIFKKRYNVAASRARNQLWIVHSLDPAKDLQPSDYRRRLIEHAIDPKAWERELQKRIPAAPPGRPSVSDLLGQRLSALGYEVILQHPVGTYQIDLVIAGDRTRLAIECDGDRFHSPEKLQEDLERQAVLERLGWSFVRVRGSLFLRDEDRALAPIFTRLKELGIKPLKTGNNQRPVLPSPAVQRIIRRAGLLRHLWSPTAGQPARDQASR